jgi:hypothetical protein
MARSRIRSAGYRCRSIDSVPGSLAAAPTPHDRPPGDQHLDVRREPADHGPSAEHRDPDKHDPFAAKLIADHTEREHGGGERERVRADHPLQVRHSGVQVSLHAAKRDAYDRVVQEGQEQHEHQYGQRSRVTPASVTVALPPCVERGQHAASFFLSPGCVQGRSAQE